MQIKINNLENTNPINFKNNSFKAKKIPKSTSIVTIDKESFLIDSFNKICKDSAADRNYDSLAEDIKRQLYTNAWTNSKLRATFHYACLEDKKWSIAKYVWRKKSSPDAEPFCTPNLVDAYLVNCFLSGKRNYHGENPLKQLESNEKLSLEKMTQLRILYKGAMNLRRNDLTLINPNYENFKQTVDIDALSKSIENLEKHYRDKFSEFFWVDVRKQRFIEALNDECAKLNKKIKLSKDIYKEIMEVAFDAL